MTLSCKDRLFLVGPMGAGKSSIGKSLALVTERPFLDVDEEIVKYAQMSIPEIFENSGESAFRDIETEVLKRCISFDAVIATGGGIVGREENRRILAQSGVVFYLYADVETQYQRTLHDNNRPMIATDDRRARLESIFKVRDPLYRECSDFIVPSSEMNIRDCVEMIKAKLKEI